MRTLFTVAALAACSLLAGCASSSPTAAAPEPAAAATASAAQTPRHEPVYRYRLGGGRVIESPWPIVFGPDQARFNGPDNSHYPQ